MRGAGGDGVSEVSPPRPDLPTAGLAPANAEPDWIASRAWSDWEPPADVVRGEFYRADVVEGIAGPSDGGRIEQLAMASLLREPTNDHDQHAIRVEISDQHVGYVAAELAAWISPVMDELGCPVFAVAAMISRDAYVPDAPQVYLWLGRRLTPGPEIEIPLSVKEALGEHPPVSSARWVESKGPAIDTYFGLRDQIEGAWAARDFAFVARAFRETVEILDAVVAEVLAQEGVFWTSLPPAIAHGGSCMALFGDRAGLARMHSVLEANEELRQWLGTADEAIADEGLSRVVQDYVGEHPGVLQKDLHGLLDCDKAGVGRVCWMLSQAGRLERVKTGTSYAVRLSPLAAR